jgi:iron complex outermembrane receptor protein
MRKFFFLLLSMVISNVLLAQQKTFTITIVDSKTGIAIPNVSAEINNKVVLGSKEGILIINGDANQKVALSSIGYNAAQIKLGEKTTIKILMEAAARDMGEVVVLGSRSGARIRTETAVPVDVIRINQVGLTSGRMDLTNALNMAAPSFNYNKQTGSDGADHIDLGTLRGLGPDQTLVLINGKRRHQTAFVALFGTRGRGNSGTDLNAFPQSAVDRIEILRDGASAQYGSDALAGVMNIILKKEVNTWNVNAGWAGYYDNKYNAIKTKSTNQYYYSNAIDGGTFTFSANHGVKLNNNGGFINFSMDYLNQAKTFRQTPDTNVSTNPNALPVNYSRRAFGDGSVATIGAMFNMELPTNESKKTIVYAFGGVNNKASDAYAYTRNAYSTATGENPRFPIDDQGNLFFDPNIMHVTNDNVIYYNPHIQTIINDLSLAAGVKGKTHHNWNWDLSNTIGKNDFHYYGDKTYNTSALTTNGSSRQTHFDDGGFNFTQNTLNLDFDKDFASIASGLNLAFGAEFRYENYNIYRGEQASYKLYNTSQAAGSQGFPGFSPNDEVNASRSNFSFYADAELKASKSFLVDGAIRAENYSDFGSVLTYKLASRYKASKNFNFRGSVSTGFRAPSLQQINFSNTLTGFLGSQLVQSRIVSNSSDLARIAGIDKLRQETSTNFSLGFAWKPINGLTITIDEYMVKVKDRIVLSGLFSAGDTINSPNDPALPTALTNEMKNLNVQTA